VNKKVKAKQTHFLTEPDSDADEVTEAKPSNVVDLLQLLKNSLGDKSGKSPKTSKPDSKQSA
jgi:DNA end-binding protein Ku